MSFEGGVAKIKSGMLRGRKVPSYTVVLDQAPKDEIDDAAPTTK
jgi:hypothetical protein